MILGQILRWTGEAAAYFVYVSMMLRTTDCPVQYTESFGVRVGIVLCTGLSWAQLHQQGWALIMCKSVLAGCSMVPQCFVTSNYRRLWREKMLDPSKSPVDQAGLLNRLGFAWITRLTQIGFERRLEPEDIPPLPTAERTKREGKRFHIELSKEGRQAHPSFLRLLLRLYGRSLLRFGMWKLFNLLVDLTSPLLLKVGLKSPTQPIGYINRC